MAVTVGGGGVVPLTEVELQRRARRRDIQAYFNAFESDPQQIFDAMEQFGVTAAELADCMDYRMDAIGWMRANGAWDGLGGLKVWPESDVIGYLDWQAKQINPFNPGETIGQRWETNGITDPHTHRTLRVAAHRELDRDARRKAINPSYVTPWK